MSDKDRITSVRRAHHVLMDFRVTQTLVIRCTDNIAGIDETLDTRNAIIDLLRGSRAEVDR